jgi:hypothetical protein
MDNTKKIRSLSRFLRFSCIVGMIAGPLLNAFYWIHDGFRIFYFENTKWMVKFADTPYLSIDELSPWQKFEGFLTDLIPYFFFLIILLIMTRLFSRFEKLDFFSERTVRYIRQIGFVLMISLIIHPFYVTLHSYIVSIPNSMGQRVVVFAYGPNEIKILFLALISFLAAHIMEEGRRLFEENSSTI